MVFQVCLFEDGVQAVPVSWIDGDICKYPPYMNQIKIKKAIASMEDPGDNWVTHQIFRKFGHTTDDYNTAIQKAKLAEIFSDIDTDEGTEDKIKRRERASKNLGFDDDQDWMMDSPIERKKKNWLEPKTLPKPPPPPELRRSPRKKLWASSSRPTTFQSTTSIEPISHSTSTGGTPKALKKEGFEAELLKKVNQILIRVRRIESKLDDMKTISQNDQINPLDNDPFPLNTKEDVEKLERNCQEDPVFMEKFVATLKCLGGGNVGEATLKILKRIMTNSLAEQHSLLGRKKMGFKALSLYKVIFLTVKCHFKDMTEKEFDPIIARWLVQAKLRRIRWETITHEANEDLFGEDSG